MKIRIILHKADSLALDGMGNDDRRLPFNRFCLFKGLNKLSEVIPDLVLLDIMMPEINGWDVAAKIKENPKWSDIPIVFLTVKGDTMSIGMGGIVAEDYITKPFDIVDLKNRVERILNKY